MSMDHRPSRRNSTAGETMIEFLRSATIVLMGAVVIGAGVIVVVYG
jgi:hypothetical protein